MTEKITVSSVGPSWCCLLPEAHRWANEMAVLVKAEMKGQIAALVWPYRTDGDQGNEMLTVDLAGSEGGDFSITFGTGCAIDTDYGFADLRQTSFHVPDLTEAMSMASLLLEKLSATVRLPSRS
ncbi:hypothetical protein F2S72_01375 [Pseudomonas syringae pv. actinidiae]|nr:hypothetical protein [Pseudomonas syringae pv. actinidiae]